MKNSKLKHSHVFHTSWQTVTTITLVASYTTQLHTQEQIVRNYHSSDFFFTRSLGHRNHHYPVHPLLTLVKESFNVYFVYLLIFQRNWWGIVKQKFKNSMLYHVYRISLPNSMSRLQNFFVKSLPIFLNELIFAHFKVIRIVCK